MVISVVCLYSSGHYSLFVYSWEEVEKEAGVQLVYKTGGVNWAKKSEMGHLIDKYAVAMDANNIRYKTSSNNH